MKTLKIASLGLVAMLFSATALAGGKTSAVSDWQDIWGFSSPAEQAVGLNRAYLDKFVREGGLHSSTTINNQNQNSFYGDTYQDIGTQTNNSSTSIGNQITCIDSQCAKLHQDNQDSNQQAQNNNGSGNQGVGSGVQENSNNNNGGSEQ